MKVVVVRKTPKLDVLAVRSPERLEQLRAQDVNAYASLRAAADSQAEANESVTKALHSVGFETRNIARDEFQGAREGEELVITVGGDGTMLDVSHQVMDTPILGFNSDPERSVGYFCAADAHRADAFVEGLAAGDVESKTLRRIALVVDGVEHPYPCMNDLLVTNQNPAMMSRYVLSAGQRTETHASSGMWISTPAGSTAGIRSAGGTVMPLEGSLIQYLVREPYTAGVARYPLLKGVRELEEGLMLRSLMDGGMIYVDGPYIQIPFRLGAALKLTRGPSLRVVGLEPARRER
jgi:NAD+ kinase